MATISITTKDSATFTMAVGAIVVDKLKQYHFFETTGGYIRAVQTGTNRNDLFNPILFSEIEIDGVTYDDVYSTLNALNSLNSSSTEDNDTTSEDNDGVNRVTETITNSNQYVTLDCPNSSGAIVVVNGVWSGTLESVNVNNNVEGGRLLFLSGKGSKGTNKIINTNTQISQEYRVITGGDSYSIKSSNDFVGSVDITIISSESTNMVFINGAVHSAVEEATRDSRSFLTSTGTEAVPSGNILACKLENPLNSGVNIIVTNRIFSNDLSDGDENLEYVAYSNPTITTLSNVSNGVNLKSGDSFSVALFSYESNDSDNIVMGGSLGSGEILPNGTPYNRKLDFIMPPGTSLGFTIDGSGRNISNAARMSIILEWYEENSN